MNSSTLVTEKAVSSLSTSIDKLVDNIKNHEAQAIDISHLGVVVVHEGVYDNAPTLFDDSPNSRYGNKVGTVTLQFRQNGVIYKIPASLSPYGVPRIPVITTQLQAEAFSLAPEGEPQPYVGVLVDFQATQATQVTWQVYLNSGWTDMNFSFFYQNGVKYASFPGTGYHTFEAYNATFTYKNTDGTSGTTTKTSGDVSFTTPSYDLGQPTAQTAALTLSYLSGDTSDKIYLGKIRLKIDNSAIGGGVKYSSECIVTLEDQTGSWIVSSIDHPWTPLELNRLFRFKVWSYNHNPTETAIYRGKLGKELVQRMVSQSADFNELKEKVIVMLNESMTMTRRFQTYRALIKDCFKKYWSDCPDAYVRKELSNDDTNV